MDPLSSFDFKYVKPSWKFSPEPKLGRTARKFLEYVPGVNREYVKPDFNTVFSGRADAFDASTYVVSW
jgi:hypothetical protein